MREVLILGCGYTGRHVAARLLAHGVSVVAAARDEETLASLAERGATVVAFDAARPASWGGVASAAARLTPGFAVLLSVPPLERLGVRGDATAALLATLSPPGRVVYLSSTSVYGGQRDVDAETAAAPRTHEGALRLDAERGVARGPWSSLVLRASAIYGPGRGLHARAGAAPRRGGDPDRVVSRIHVDDLAALCEAALASGLTGAYPAADSSPASAREVAAFCASLGLVPPALPDRIPGPHGGRRVDGRAAFEALGVALAYPSYREGVVASIAAPLTPPPPPRRPPPARGGTAARPRGTRARRRA
ncbi:MULTISPECIES: NAD-dependent epimerase/dehydratase family protein [Anaeromyxobacter]|uniref:NAD-dependent epimerase/dehydratase family protein n=1 Tax=Anaeromyxobacter TaxID=161492 RepID=UPI001F57C44D|nr:MULTISPECIES: NAD-dependent epimerase/dehydratase family protein [unclassified Anaeromyxobacter]